MLLYTILIYILLKNYSISKVKSLCYEKFNHIPISRSVYNYFRIYEVIKISL